MIDILLTHSVAHREGKPPFFFSRFNFERMKALGHTHYCCACITSGGFRLDRQGKVVNANPKGADRLQKYHDDTHLPYTIGNANEYDNPWSWLENEVKPDFPYILSIPSLP